VRHFRNKDKYKIVGLKFVCDKSENLIHFASTSMVKVKVKVKVMVKIMFTLEQAT